MDVHLGVEEASGSLNDGGSGVGGLDLVDGTLGVGDDSDELNKDILGVHVDGEGVGKLLLLASLNLEVVGDRGEVADNLLVSRGVLGELLGGGEDTSDESDIDGLAVVVGDLDDGLDGATVDELHAEDVGLGKGGGDIGEERGGSDGGGSGSVILERWSVSEGMHATMGAESGESGESES